MAEVVVYTSVDQVFSAPVFQAFERESGIRVRAVFDTEETKSTGVLNRLIAEAEAPQADVFWSGDPVRPFLLIGRGLVEPYVSPEAESLPAGLRAGDGSWTGVAARARVLLLNRELVPEEETLHSAARRLGGGAALDAASVLAFVAPPLSWASGWSRSGTDPASGGSTAARESWWWATWSSASARWAR